MDEWTKEEEGEGGRTEEKGETGCDLGRILQTKITDARSLKNNPIDRVCGGRQTVLICLQLCRGPFFKT